MCLQSGASLLPSLHGRVYVVSHPCRLCSLSVGQGGGDWGIPGGTHTHTWEVIESEEMAQGEKGGPSSRNGNPVHVKKKVRWSRTWNYSMLTNVLHMYICSLCCEDCKWHLELSSSFKRTLIYHIILTPQWQKHICIWAFLFHLWCILMHFSAHFHPPLPRTHMCAHITLFHKMKSPICTHYTTCLLLLNAEKVSNGIICFKSHPLWASNARLFI